MKSHGAISEAKVQELLCGYGPIAYLSMGRNQPMMHLQEFGEADKTWRSIEHCLHSGIEEVTIVHRKMTEIPH